MQSAAEFLIILQMFLHTFCHAVTSTFDHLTLNFYSSEAAKSHLDLGT